MAAMNVLHNFDTVIMSLTERVEGRGNFAATKAIALLHSLRLEAGPDKWLSYWGHGCVAIFLSQPDNEGDLREYDIEIDPRDCTSFCAISYRLPNSKPWTHISGVAQTLQEAVEMIQFAVQSMGAGPDSVRQPDHT